MVPYCSLGKWMRNRETLLLRVQSASADVALSCYVPLRKPRNCRSEAAFRRCPDRQALLASEQDQRLVHAFRADQEDIMQAAARI